MRRTSASGGPSSRLASLDGLRGAAALIVFVHHGMLVIPEIAEGFTHAGDGGWWSWLVSSPIHILAAGNEAVIVFFVLSGIVLTLPVLKSEPFNWRAYYPSRLIRLYLPVFAAVVWSVVFVLVLPRAALADDPSVYVRSHAEPLTALDVLSNALLLTGTTSLNGPLWSLRWEVIFSLLLPLYVWLALRVSRHWLAVTLLIAVLIGIFGAAGYWGLTFLPMFAIGVVLAVALPALKSIIVKVNDSPARALIWGAACAAALFGITAEWTVGALLPPERAGVTAFLVVLGATLWVVIALGSRLADRVLSSRPLQWLGAISFSLYLTHEPIIIAVAQILPDSIDGYTVLISGPIALLVAWGFFNLIEGPSHRLSQAVRARHSISRRPGRVAAESPSAADN